MAQIQCGDAVDIGGQMRFLQMSATNYAGA
jgi:hypothetical protein